jgi:hypothetical protein
MSRLKLLICVLMIALAAVQGFTQQLGWFSPFIAALGIIMLVALTHSKSAGDDF